MIRKAMALVLVCFALLGTLLIMRTEVFKGAPQLHCVPRTLDFGFVAEEEFAEAQIQLANRGTSELNVLDVRVSCNCTAVQINKRRLAPGEVTEVVVKVRGNHHARNVAEIAIITNERESNVTRIPLRFQSKRGIWSEESPLSFGHVKHERAELTSTQEFFLDTSEKKSPDAIQLETDAQFDRAFAIARMPPANSKLGFVVRLTNPPVGFVSGKIMFRDQLGNTFCQTVDAYIAHGAIDLIKPALIRSNTPKAIGFASVEFCDGNSVTLKKVSLLDEQVAEIVSVNAEGKVFEFECESKSNYTDGQTVISAIFSIDETRDVEVWIPIRFQRIGYE